ncbi:MAG: hypothetical protein O3C49_10075 [Proteobacteria bacterium]|nr:hypothetical protein [Pseudomonadota bacterium]MDA1326410.1 hypothetical protein [Pseudomonadota bacterium]
MRPHLVTAIALLALTVHFSAHAAPQNHSAHHSAYGGQQHRAIKSLSHEDVEELRRGGGWGLAKAAELNGMPGPAHVLELKDKIALTPDQTTTIKAIFQDMQRRAVAKGEQLIALEMQLDHGFKTRHITDQRLRALLTMIAQAREDLRYIHLSMHLKTPKILTDTQISQYNILRGYK